MVHGNLTEAEITTGVAVEGASCCRNSTQKTLGALFSMNILSSLQAHSKKI